MLTMGVVCGRLLFKSLGVFKCKILNFGGIVNKPRLTFDEILELNPFPQFAELMNAAFVLLTEAVQKGGIFEYSTCLVEDSNGQIWGSFSVQVTSQYHAKMILSVGTVRDKDKSSSVELRFTSEREESRKYYYFINDIKYSVQSVSKYFELQIQSFVNLLDKYELN